MGFKSKPGDGMMNKGMKGGGRTLKNNSVAEVVARIFRALRSREKAKPVN